MIGVVLVTHGTLGQSLRETAEWVLGAALDRFEVVGLDEKLSPDQQMRMIEAAVRSVGSDGVVILTDLFGGTPQNLALTLLADGRVDVVSGVNLPMLLALPADRAVRVNPGELASNLARKGSSAIVVASETLRRHRDASKEMPALQPG
jgi:PTS system mannose-specific IIA component